MAEYVRRRESGDRRRRQRFGRLLAPLVKAAIGEHRSTVAWERGGRAEERVGAYLTRALRAVGFVLHDRVIPGTHSNIDHIVVVSSGVWVVDTKCYGGQIQRRNLGGWLFSRRGLFVNGRDRTALVAGMSRQITRVARVTGDVVPVRGALCFVDAERERLARPFTIDGVTITWPKRLVRSLHRPGPLDPATIRQLAVLLAVAFPSYRT
jgi:hypothetical protein